MAFVVIQTKNSCCSAASYGGFSKKRKQLNYIDIIQGVGTIKSFQKEDFFLENTKGLYGFFQAAIFRLGLIGLRFGLLAEFLGIVLMIGIISLACYLIVADTLKVGELMAILSVSIVPAVIRISTANIPLQEAKIAFDRMYEFASLPQEKKVFSEHTFLENIQSLSVENLSFRFAGRKTLFQNLSFTTQKGEILGIMGENGVGKSTLFQIIQKIYEQEQGTFYFNHLIIK